MATAKLHLDAVNAIKLVDGSTSKQIGYARRTTHAHHSGNTCRFSLRAQIHKLARHMKKAAKIGIVYLFLDTRSKYGQIIYILDCVQDGISPMQQLAQTLLVIHIDLLDLKLTAGKRSHNLVSAFLVIVRNSYLIYIRKFSQCAHGNTSHSASATKYNDLHKALSLEVDCVPGPPIPGTRQATTSAWDRRAGYTLRYCCRGIFDRCKLHHALGRGCNQLSLHYRNTRRQNSCMKFLQSILQAVEDGIDLFTIDDQRRLNTNHARVIERA